MLPGLGLQEGLGQFRAAGSLSARVSQMHALLVSLSLTGWVNSATRRLTDPFTNEQH